MVGKSFNGHKNVVIIHTYSIKMAWHCLTSFILLSVHQWDLYRQFSSYAN